MAGLSKSFLAVALFPCLLLPAAGQIRSNARLVLVPVTVTDRNGATVNGLDRAKFTVFEDNVPRPIVAFNSEDAPASVGLIFDISGSMRDRLNLAKTALRAFVEDSNPEDEAFLLTVSSRPEAYSDFTSDLEALASAAQFTRAGGSTALVDTIFVGLDRIRSASHTRRALLILSDGMDNHSRHSRSELMRRAVEADVQIYTIVIDSRVRTKKPIELQEENRGIAFMQDLAGKAGGLAFVISDHVEAQAVVANAVLALRNEYVLAYRPAETDQPGKWHRIRVSLNVSNLHVLARNGYYSQ